MLTDWRRERVIWKALKTLAQQRVALILQPGNVLVIERGRDERDEQVVRALLTCRLRGWAEIALDAMPRAQLKPDGSLPDSWEGIAPVYRLTEAGWAELRRTYDLLVWTFFMALISAVATLMTLAR